MSKVNKDPCESPNYTERHRRSDNGGILNTEILQRVPVAQSTISRWCRAIPLSVEQRERLVEKKRNTPLITRLRTQASRSRENAAIWAKELTTRVTKLDGDDLLSLMGAALYWAEGTKLNDAQRNIGHKGVEFTNTDPRMVKIMMQFLRQVITVPEDKFRVIVRIGKSGDVERAEQYWSQMTGVPRTNFRRPELLTLSTNSKSLSRYPCGMCRIVVNDVSRARKIAYLIEECYKTFYSEL